MAWLLISIAAVAGVLLWLARAGVGRESSRPLLLAAVLSSLAGGALWSRAQARIEHDQLQLYGSIPAKGRPGGYVSSDACRACHPAEYQSWHRSYHRTMTQPALPETVKGAFDGQAIHLRGKTYRLERRGDEFWMNLPDPSWRPSEGGTPAWMDLRVRMLTGSHWMQALWFSSATDRTMFIGPLIWLVQDQRWVARRDVFLQDPSWPEWDPQIWNYTCIQCHATGGQPRPVREGPQRGTYDTRVGELGIACESCHGPGEAHARANQSPVRRFLLHLRSAPDPTIVNPKRLDARAQSRVCGSCHAVRQVLDARDWNDHGYRYRPGDPDDPTTKLIRPRELEQDPALKKLVLDNDPMMLEWRFWPDGIARVSGRELNTVSESACYQRGELSCLSCHSMHDSEPNDQLAPEMLGDRACLSCHAEYQDQIAEHTHHRPDSSGASCMGCHMPYTIYGLLKGIRTHHISSPSVRTTLETGRPDACSLCHLDRSLGWVADHLSGWYRAPRPPLSTTDTASASGVRWALTGNAALRALVADAFARPEGQNAAGHAWMAPVLAPLLEDPYPAVRYIAARALHSLPGFEDVPYDFIGDEGSHRAARREVNERWERVREPAYGAHALEGLVDPQGRVIPERLEAVLKTRDDRSMFLQE